MRGRKPKPTTIKALEGNPGRRPLNGREPQAPPGIPECPDFLGEEARAEWFRMAKVLSDMGLLTLADRAAFTAYCVAYGRWVEAEKLVRKFGMVVKSPVTGSPMKSPYLTVADQSMESMRKLLVEFGLTPSSRSRIRLICTMNLQELQASPEKFQNEIYLPTGKGTHRFGDVMAKFQRKRFAIINPSLLAIARHESPPIARIWDERTKGASKDTDWSINLLWLLAFSRRSLRIQIGAYDQQQADEVRLIVKSILRLAGPINKFLSQVVEVQGDKIINRRTESRSNTAAAWPGGSARR